MAGRQDAIGFVGIGQMGRPMVERLVGAGCTVVAYDRRAEALAGLVAEPAADAGEVARRAATVITMLPNSTIVEAVVLGPDGLLAELRPGDLLIDMSSSRPSSTRRLAETLAARGVRMLDAPVSGGVAGARAGTLAIMVGGEAADFEQASPIFEALGRSIQHVGGHGMGHTLKALNNLLSACTLAATSEVVTLAARAGIDPTTALRTINAGTGRSWSSEYKLPTFVLTRAFNSGFSLGLMQKDVEIATELARELGAPLFTGAAAQQLLSYAVGREGPDACHTSLARVLEAWCEVELRAHETNDGAGRAGA